MDVEREPLVSGDGLYEWTGDPDDVLPVAAAYVIGERGTELIVPTTSGHVDAIGDTP